MKWHIKKQLRPGTRCVAQVLVLHAFASLVLGFSRLSLRSPSLFATARLIPYCLLGSLARVVLLHLFQLPGTRRHSILYIFWRVLSPCFFGLFSSVLPFSPVLVFSGSFPLDRLIPAPATLLSPWPSVIFCAVFRMCFVGLFFLDLIACSAVRSYMDAVATLWACMVDGSVIERAGSGRVGVTAGPAQLRLELQPGVAARADFIKY